MRQMKRAVLRARPTGYTIVRLPTFTPRLQGGGAPLGAPGRLRSIQRSCLGRKPDVHADHFAEVDRL